MVENSSYSIRLTPKQFRELTIASDDDRDYQESGWVAIRVSDEECYLTPFGHCSCYGTFTCLAGGGISDYYEQDQAADIVFFWKGTRAELVDLATRKADPHLPDRDADEKDSDYDHLVEVYKQIIEWDAKSEATPCTP